MLHGLQAPGIFGQQLLVQQACILLHRMRGQLVHALHALADIGQHPLLAIDTTVHLKHHGIGQVVADPLQPLLALVQMALGLLEAGDVDMGPHHPP